MQPEVYERINAVGDRHWWFVARRRIVATALARMTSGGNRLRVLEAGCGPGHNLSMLAHFGPVSAFEPDRGAFRHAAGRGVGEVREGGLPDAVPYEAESFDVALVLDVLEHLEDDATALAKVATMLAPGGLLIVTVPAYPWLWSRHDETHHHRRRYTLAELRGLAELVDLDVVVASHFNSLLLPAIAGVRLAGRLVGRQGEDDAMPPSWLNAMLTQVFGLERHVIGRLPLPAGVSIFLAARRK